MSYRARGERASRSWDLEEEDPERPVLEIAIHWGDTVVYAEHRAETFAISAPFPEPHGPLVTFEGQSATLIVPPEARGELDLDDGFRPITPDDTRVKLTLGDRARVQLGAFTYEVGLVPRGRRSPWVARSFAGISALAISLLLHAVAILVLGASTKPPLEEREEEAISREMQTHFLRIHHKVIERHGEDYPEIAARLKSDSCRPPPPWFVHVMDRSVEKKLVETFQFAVGASRALSVALPDHYGPLGPGAPMAVEDDAYLPADYRLGGAYARVTGLGINHWLDGVALGPNPANHEWNLAVFSRRYPYRRPPVRLLLDGVAEPALRVVILANAPALLACVPAERTEVTFVVEPDGATRDVMAEPCIERIVRGTTFFAVAEPTRVHFALQPDE